MVTHRSIWVKYKWLTILTGIVTAILISEISVRAQSGEWQVFSRSSGELAGDMVTGLAEDSSGNIWVSAYGGLMKFDGDSWHSYTTANADIPSDYLHDVAVNPDGSIWIATNAGIGVLESDDWTTYTKESTNSELKNDMINVLDISDDGTAWIGTLGSGVLSCNGSAWSWYIPDNSPVNSYYIDVLCTGTGNSVWVAGNYGITGYSDGNWTHYDVDIPDVAPENVKVNGIAATAEGNPVVGTSYGFSVYSEGTWTLYTPTEGGHEYNYARPHAVNGTTIWFACYDGMGSYDGGNWSFWNTDNSPLPYKTVNDILVDRHGNVWIATSQGLAVYNPTGVAFGDGFSLVVDTNLVPDTAAVPGPDNTERPVGVIVTPEGTRMHLVENEMVVKAANLSEAEAIAEDLGGTVISDGTIPETPSELEHLRRDIPLTDGYYLLNIAPSPADLLETAAHAEAVQLEGTVTCSSEAVRNLFASILSEKVVQKRTVGFNSVGFEDQCFHVSTQERPLSSGTHDSTLANEGYMDAFGLNCFNDPDIRLTDAWQIMELYGNLESAVPLCVIDRGFILNDDFPSYSGYDFINDDRNPESHDAGYHGTGCISISCAEWDNRFGSAGTGAPVVWPMAFRQDLSMYTSARAIRTAVRWGAEVVSMSFHFDWGYFDWMGGGIQLEDAIDLAYDHNVVCLAAAGNQGHDLGDVRYLPAEGGSTGKHPIVVGAIDLDTKRAIRSSDGFSWSSCYGSEIDIWAPGGGSSSEIVTTPDPDHTDYRSFGGTSCATPYVAGIVAMMRAVNPELPVDDIRDILHTTSSTSPDSRVWRGFINAYSAVREAIEEPGSIYPWPDAQEPCSVSSAREITSGTYCGNLSLADPDDGFWFYIDDFRHVTIDYQFNFFGNFVHRLVGAATRTGESLPFDADVRPGSYHINFTHTFIIPGFYSFDLSISDSLAIPPDRFEDNDIPGLDGEITFPAASIGGIYAVEDLTFHDDGDSDYYKLSLPELPVSATGYDELVTIFIEPDSLGSFTTFQLVVFEGSDYETFGRACTLEDIRTRFPDGEVRFLVEDYMDHRNYYRIEIGYDRSERGIEPSPTFTLTVMPEWLENIMAIHPMDLPANRLSNTPIPFTFPSAPESSQLIIEEQTPTSLPPEQLLLVWETDNDLSVAFSHSGNEDMFSAALIDVYGDHISEAAPPAPSKIAQDTTEQVLLLDVPDLPKGMYGLEVRATSFPMSYTITFDPDITTAVHDTENDSPESFGILHQNFPNPFNPTTTISFFIPDDGIVRIKVYDILGKYVASPAENHYSAGTHHVVWDASDLNGNPVSNGIYFYAIESGNFRDVKRMLFLK